MLNTQKHEQLASSFPCTMAMTPLNDDKVVQTVTVFDEKSINEIRCLNIKD
jgi:hypothetical protein